MEPVIRELALRRFRSILGDQVTFDNPTVIVGRNGSGKSNFADAFAFLAEAMVSPLQAIFDKRGGISTVRNRTPIQGYPSNLGMLVKFGRLNADVEEARYAFEVEAEKNLGYRVVREQCLVLCRGQRVWFDRDPSGFRSSVPGLNPALDSRALGLPVVGGESHFAPVVRTLAAMRLYSIEPTRIRETWSPGSGQALCSDGSNLASVLLKIERSAPDHLQRIGEVLSVIVPDIATVKPVRRGRGTTVLFTEHCGPHGPMTFESPSMSDGTLRALALLAAVYQTARPSVLVMEEPEASLDLHSLAAVLGILDHASRTMQVVAITYSPDALDAEWLKPDHVRLATWEAGITRLVPLARGSRQAWDERLASAGELLRSNALWPEKTAQGEVPNVPLFASLDS